MSKNKLSFFFKKSCPAIISFFLLIAVFIFTAGTTTVSAAQEDITFTWEANPSEEMILGYRLYYGSSSRYYRDQEGKHLKSNFSYDFFIDFTFQKICPGDATDVASCPSLPPDTVTCSNYFLEPPECTVLDLESPSYYALSAYTFLGYESDYADELSNFIFNLNYTAGSNGSVSGSTPQLVGYGSSGTAVEAIPDPGFNFSNWSDGSTYNPRTDTNVISNISVTANFTDTFKTLTYTAGANGSITGTTPQTVVNGADGTEVTAVPDPGYSFESWTDGSYDNPRTDTHVTADISVTAIFIADRFTLLYLATPGTINDEPYNYQEIVYGSNGTEVTVVPPVGYHFVDWSDASIDNPRTDTNVTDHIIVQANYEINTYTFEYTAGTNGSIAGPTSQNIEHGNDGAMVEAIPDPAYQFIRWSDGSIDNPRIDTNATKNVSVEANFAPDRFILVYLAGLGTINGNSFNIQAVESGEAGTPILVVPPAGYSFVDWSDASIDNPRTDTNVTDDIYVGANYEIDTYTLEYTSGTNGGITGTTPQTVVHGADGTAITAVADPGYHFVDWSDGSTYNPRTDTHVTSDISVTANFTLSPFPVLTYIAGGNGSITGITPQTVSYGTDGDEVTAVPDPGYSFADWSDGSTDNPRKDTNVTSNITVTANFEPELYTRTFTLLYFASPGTIHGEPYNQQEIEYGGTGAVVTVVPPVGYHFVDWSDGSTDNPRKDTNVTSNIVVTANYAIDTFYLLYVAELDGTINGSSYTFQTVDFGTDGTSVEAVPPEGYYFIQWSDGSTSNPRIDVNVTSHINVTAKFTVSKKEFSWPMFMPAIIGAGQL